MQPAIAQEEKNKKIAAIVSITIHAILLLLLIYVMAWRPQIPPPPEIGMEMQFGLDVVGSGENDNALGPEETVEQKETKAEEVQPEQPQPTEPVKASENVVTSKMDDAVPIKKEETPEPKKEPVKEPEKVKSAYPGKKGTDETAGGGGGKGDDNAPGVKGDPRGTMGKGRGGSGNLDMQGWMWDEIPRPKDTSSETGYIIFDISIDADGNIKSVNVRETNVSPAVVRLYRDEVYKTTFSTTSGAAPQAGATGKITFILKAQ